MADRNRKEAFPESPPKSRSSDLTQIISAERARLMKAEAVLGCVAFTLLYEDWLESPNRPCFADAVAVAQDLINEALVRLGPS